ncbi:hypothetical protein QU487_06560 [Crenobacter sp. SG2305]|uniref:hypothetical protein n=1 Tax=Crenobacter oryzisoli TaxID=3056844 RepID=UPI0025AA9614|nr:hypothetical protein [Crenobacter sp. SG2305]MDN0082415.1 hypothetical protein [Crenobacter sp. SG2305]
MTATQLINAGWPIALLGYATYQAVYNNSRKNAVLVVVAGAVGWAIGHYAI